MSSMKALGSLETVVRHLVDADALRAEAVEQHAEAASRPTPGPVVRPKGPGTGTGNSDDEYVDEEEAVDAELSRPISDAAVEALVTPKVQDRFMDDRCACVTPLALIARTNCFCVAAHWCSYDNSGLCCCARQLRSNQCGQVPCRTG